MFFNKKKKMIDVRELQKRGVVRLPKKDIVVPTNKDGFVELQQQATNDEPQTKSNFFNFMNTTPTSSNSESYSKREVDEKTTNLDNKIYKLEQRIELLERKLKIEKEPKQKLGVMGW